MISHAAATDIPIAHPIIPPNRAKNIFCIVYSLNHYDFVVISARVCVRRKFLSDWGGMCNLAFIAATILNFRLTWPGWLSQPKIQNCGGNEC